MLKIPETLASLSSADKPKSFDSSFPNPIKAFFKTAKEWTQLSGYMSAFPTPSHKSSNFNKLFDISQEDHEERVETAINYLILRDLGCSREKAISLTGRRRPDNGSFVKSLPQNLRKGFSSKILQDRCVPCRQLESFGDFYSISSAFKDLIMKQQIFASPTSGISKSLNEKRLEAEREERLNIEKKREKKIKFDRVIVPEIKSEKYTEIPVSSAKDCLDQHKPVANRKSLIVPEKTHYLNEIKSEETYQSLSHKPSAYSYTQENTPVNKPANHLKPSQALTQETTPISQSERAKLSYSKSSANVFHSKLNSFQKNEEIKVELASSDSESELVSFPKLANEDKRLINLIRLQKYRQAQIKGEEVNKGLQKTIQRKKMLDLRSQEERKKKFEKKKEKISLAKIRKESLLMRKVKNVSK